MTPPGPSVLRRPLDSTKRAILEVLWVAGFDLGPFLVIPGGLMGLAALAMAWRNRKDPPGPCPHAAAAECVEYRIEPLRVVRCPTGPEYDALLRQICDAALITHETFATYASAFIVCRGQIDRSLLEPSGAYLDLLDDALALASITK